MNIKKICKNCKYYKDKCNAVPVDTEVLLWEDVLYAGTRGNFIYYEMKNRKNIILPLTSHIKHPGRQQCTMYKKR